MSKEISFGKFTELKHGVPAISFGGGKKRFSILISDDTIASDATVGSLVGSLFMIGGVGAPTFTIQSQTPLGLFSIDGNDLEVAADLSSLGGTTASVTIRVTDAESNFTDVQFTINIVVVEDPNGSGLTTGDGNVVDDGNWQQIPKAQDTSTGLKFVGKNKGVAKFIYDISTMVAGGEYTFRYTANWSNLSSQGRYVFVGFGFKEADNDFYFIGLKGDGSNPTVMQRYQINGTANFNNISGFTETNGGAATNGTKNGPTTIRLTVSGDGTQVTLKTSGDGGETFDDELILRPVSPVGTVQGANTVGLAVYMPANDIGVFEMLIEEWTANESSAPEDATIFLDFINEEYVVNDTSTTLASVVDQPEKRVANGLEIVDTGGASDVVDLINAAAAALTEEFTVVVEYNKPSTANGDIYPFVMTENATSAGFGDNVGIQHQSGSGDDFPAGFSDFFSVASFVEALNEPGNNKIALTRRDNGMALSHNGNVIATDLRTDTGAPRTFNHGSFGGWPGDDFAGAPCFIRTFTFYNTPKDDADLPQLSTL